MPNLNFVTAIVLLFAQDSSPEQKITIAQREADMRQLIGTFQKYYALGEIKLNAGLADLSANNEDWIGKARDPGRTDTNFAELLIDWTAQLDDGHVTVAFPFNWSASLGFTVDVYPKNGTDFLRVVDINQDRLPDRFFGFQKGWELRSIDGQEVSDLLNEYMRFTRSGYEISTKRIAARLLTQRLQSVLPSARESIVGANFGMESEAICPSSNTRFEGHVAEVVFWDHGGTPHSYRIKWCISGEDRRFTRAVNPGSAALMEPVAELSASRAQLVQSPKKPYVWQSDWAAVTQFSNPAPAEANKPDEDFFYHTILFDNTNGSPYLFIRIPSFSLDPAVADIQRTNRVLGFASILNKNRTTRIGILQVPVKGLIIDLMGNPGGSIWFCQQILEQIGRMERGNLTFETAKFRVRPSYEWLAAFDSYIANPALTPTAVVGFKQAREAIRAQLDIDGRPLTDSMPINLKGESTLTAATWPTAFKMPVIVLVDELTASAGDLFAAVVKQQRLGAIAGVRTMGAGGTVAVYRGTLNTEADVTVTVSEMQDPEGAALENVGVIPDYPITFRTEADIRILSEELGIGSRPKVTEFMKGVYQAVRDRRTKMSLPQ